MPPVREKRWTIQVCKCGYISGEADPSKPACRGEHDWQEVEAVPASSLLEARQRVEELERALTDLVGRSERMIPTTYSSGGAVDHFIAARAALHPAQEDSDG